MALRKTILPVLAGVWLLLPIAAEAAGLSADSRTYFSTRESESAGQHYTLYEYFDTDLALGEKISFHFGGWGRTDLGDESFGTSSEGEFQYGFLRYDVGVANANLRLGRLFVSEGVALHENIDGAYIGGDLAEGLRLALYGGIPVEIDDDGRDSDLVYGGRLSFGRYGIFDLGGSYLLEENDGEKFREEIGVDSYLQLGDGLRADGQSAYNSIANSWMEHDYRIAAGPYKGLTGRVYAWWVDFGSFFQSPAVSAFASPLLDSEDTLQNIGAEIEYLLTPQIAASVTYDNYAYDNAGDADAFGGKLTWSGDRTGAGLTYRRVNGAAESLRYSEYRLFVTRRIGAFDLSLDGLDVVYDEAVRGVSDAYAIAGALGYTVSDHVRLAADVEYASNPIFEEEIKAFVKLHLRFAGLGSGSGEDN